MKWEKVKLGNVCDSISDGDHQAPPKTVSGIPFVTISNINSTHQFDFSDVMYVSEDYYDNLDEKRKARIGDILYTVVGSFGIPVLIKEHKEFVFQRHIAILRPKSCIDSRFLYYTMLSRDFYKQADAVALGAAQRTVSLTSLRNMEIELPPIETQKCIADILSAYDDLIENNQKQIKLLEEAARRLYKEWFVDLHFSGYENTKIVDGVPEGWEKDILTNIVETTSGGTPSRTHPEFYVNGTNLWVKTKELNDGFVFDTEEKITDEAILRSSAKKIKAGSILLAMYGATIGKLGIVAQEMTCNQACCVFNTSEFKFGTMYLYFWLLTNRDYLISQGKGAAQSNLSQELIKNLIVLVPEQAVLQSFAKVSDKMFEKIAYLQRQKNELKQARDRLLPKLMNGEIEV